MFESRFYRVIEWIFATIMAFVLIVLLVLDNRHSYMYQNNCKVPNFVFLLIFAVIVLTTAVIKMRRHEKIAGRPQPAPINFQNTMKIIGILSSVLFIVQIVYTYEIFFETGWDCREIVTMAQALAFDGTPIADAHYFSIYPNNVFLTGLFAGILKLTHFCGIHLDYYPLIFIGCILVNISGYLFADCIRILTGRKGLIYLFWCVYVLLTGLSPWISIPYSDTYSIFFTTFLMWLFLTKDESNYFASWFFMTVTAFVGYFIKPTVLLIFMVIVFYSLFHFFLSKRDIPKKRRPQIMICSIAVIILGLAASYGMKYGMEKVTGFAPDENKQVTPIHYLMMGANYEYGGGYNQTDVNLSASYSTVKERNSEDLKEAFKRYKDMFPSKLAGFIAKKTLTNFNDGTFAWGNEGAFYWAYYERNDAVATFLRDYVYDPHEGYTFGSKHGSYVAFCQCIWFLCLCSTALMVLKGRKKKDCNEMVVMTSMLAIMCFLMVFEARARYLYLYSPIIYMTAAMGWSRLLMNKE